MLELYRTVYAGRDLDRAIVDFHSVLGGRSTEPTIFDMLVHMPIDGGGPRRVSGRIAWIVGEPAPVQFSEEPRRYKGLFRPAPPPGVDALAGPRCA